MTATYDTAKAPSDADSSYGFYVDGAFRKSAKSPVDTLISHNTATGFQDTFYDTTPDRADEVAEKWIDNTADNYLEYGFYIYYPTKYVVTGNVADANTSGKKYTGGTTDGFYFDDAYATKLFSSFAKNQAYDSEYGYYSNGDTVHGTGNIAKRNQHKFYNVAN